MQTIERESPIDDAMQELRELLRQRDASYRGADYVLDTTDRSVDACAAELHEAAAAALRGKLSDAPAA